MVQQRHKNSEAEHDSGLIRKSIGLITCLEELIQMSLIKITSMND